MQNVLVAILDGSKPPIDCHITFAKRVSGESLLWIDRHKVVFTVLFLGAIGTLIWGAIGALKALL